MTTKSFAISNYIIKSVIIIILVLFIRPAGEPTIEFAGKIVLVSPEIITKIHPVIQTLNERNI